MAESGGGNKVKPGYSSPHSFSISSTSWPSSTAQLLHGVPPGDMQHLLLYLSICGLAVASLTFLNSYFLTDAATHYASSTL